MGDAVAHLLDLPHQKFDAIQHGIEICRELVPFIGSAMNRYSSLKVALHDGSASGIDALNPSDRPTSDDHARGRAHDDNKQGRERKRVIIRR